MKKIRKIREIKHKIIVFQDKGYPADKIIQCAINNKNYPIEIFPGIFMSLHKQNKIQKKLNMSTIEFDVQNIRDRFDIVNHKIQTKNPASFEVMEREVDVQSIEYPSNLGGGACAGCPVVRYFAALTNNAGYKIITEGEIVEKTKNSIFFQDVCKSSKCHKTYQKIIREGYDKSLKASDMVKLNKYYNKVTVIEGKHRVCALKRFDYRRKIFVRETIINEKYDDNYYLLVEYKPNCSDLNEYYAAFFKLNIQREEVLNYLKNIELDLCELIDEKRSETK